MIEELLNQLSLRQAAAPKILPSEQPKPTPFDKNQVIFMEFFHGNLPCPFCKRMESALNIVDCELTLDKKIKTSYDETSEPLQSLQRRLVLTAGKSLGLDQSIVSFPMVYANGDFIVGAGDIAYNIGLLEQLAERKIEYFEGT